MTAMRTYRLKKSLKIFRHVVRLYRKKGKHLEEAPRKQLVKTLNHLQDGILSRDRKEATEYAREAEYLALSHLKKSRFERVRDFIVGLVCALLVAVVIRSVWFEFYEIPTGSMRPTLKEEDRLAVTKTPFGINIPLSRGHLYFDPALVLRSGIVIFTGAGMDIRDVNTLYFYLFPGKKQYVKRIMGKPGDTLYFYGGLMYGIDKEGNDISATLQLPELSKIDHVPYIYPNGRVILPQKPVGGIYAPVTLKQMNQKVATLSLTSRNKIKGELLSPYKDKMTDYFDLWGFKNYGMGRLLTREEVKKFTDTPLSQLSDAPLYLEIIHHPSIRYPKIMRDPLGKLQLSVGTSSSVIPFKEEHLKTLFANLYTARFVVKGGHVARYGSSMKAGPACRYCPHLPGVPDGTYEFYYGKARQVFFSGITKELPADHPLYQFSPGRVQLLYNLGIEFATYYAPMSKDQYLLPSRYVYYRDGDLYTLGAPIITKDDPTLVTFVTAERLKGQNAPSYRPHFPFIDEGPPVDAEFIKRYGITVPPKHYLALGDNYAMSADSRDFGFVPEENLRGAPTFIFYPPGERFGPPPQAHYPLTNVPRTIIWLLALSALCGWYLHHRKYHKLPIKIE